MQTLKEYLTGQKKKDFADKIGVSKSYLSQVMNGHKRVGYDMAVRIFDATGGKVDMLSVRENRK